MKAPKKADPKNNQKHAFIKAYSVIFILSLSLCAGAAYTLHQSLVLTPQQLALDALAKEHAESQANIAAKHLSKVSANIARFGERPNVADALINDKQTVLEKFRLVLKQAFPDAVNIRFIRADKLEEKRSSETNFKFTELDMINRALKDEAVLPEAIKDNKRWLLNAITPLKNPEGDGNTGVILISLPLNALLNELKNESNTAGKTSLLQSFAGAGKATPILFSGDSNLNHDGALVKVARSHWQIRFVPSQALANQSAVSPIPLFGGIGFVFILCAVLGARLAKALAKRQQETGKSLMKAAASMNAAPTSDPAMTDPMYQKQNILDVAVDEEDKDILGLTEAKNRQGSGGAQAPEEKPTQIDHDVNEHVFRSYDIRGVVGEQLTYALAEKIGKGLGTEALEHGEKWMAVARDARTHSPELCEQLINGIRSTGCGVINLGVVPTPIMHFATHELDSTSSGVMVTASHNAAEYNGFKMVINGNTLSDDAIQQLRSRIMRGDFHQGQGEEKAHNLLPEYVEKIFSDVALAGEIKIVVDAANAVNSQSALLVLEELGCEVVPLNCELDGEFPKHDPDPTQKENLQELIAKVKETEADLGVAYDGDGDRLVAVTPKGEIIWPDRLLMLFAKDIVTRHPGADVLFDVKCTRQLNSLISSYGGRPIMWKTGHAHMKSKMQETGALLGGEFSGHIFIKDRWYGFDDATYVTARLLEIITLRDQDIDTIFEGLPELPNTPEIKIEIAEEQKFDFIKRLVSTGNFESGKISTIDGLRVDFTDSWGLVRASNTSAALTLRFEGESEEALEKVLALFKREIARVDNTLALNF